MKKGRSTEVKKCKVDGRGLYKYLHAPHISFYSAERKHQMGEEPNHKCRSREGKSKSYFLKSLMLGVHLYIYFSSKAVGVMKQLMQSYATSKQNLSTADNFQNKGRSTVRHCGYLHTIYCIYRQERPKRGVKRFRNYLKCSEALNQADSLTALRRFA